MKFTKHAVLVVAKTLAKIQNFNLFAIQSAAFQDVIAQKVSSEVQTDNAFHLANVQQV